MAVRSTLVPLLKLLMVVILAAWVCVWILKPTQLWKRSWHTAEDKASNTFLGDSGLDVVVFCFPLLMVATLGYIYLHLGAREGRSRQRTIWMTSFSNPLIIRSPIGILSGGELLTAALFIGFLIWTYYSNVSSDFRRMTPSKDLKLNRWQLKMMALGVRCGSLSEVCLALLLLPILRGLALFRIFGIQFEASVRYHIWIGNGMILLSILHSASIMFIWAMKNSLLQEITKWQRTGRVNLAGGITLAAGLIIWITSLPQIRRKQFKLFYFSHHLYIVFIMFFLFHGGDRHFYLVFSGVLLFALDKILRIIQSRPTQCLISARILPCKAIELSLAKHPSLKYTPTSIIFLKIPTISRFQWHPFTICSSSNMDEEKLCVLLKCQGQWTNALYDLIQSMQGSGSGHVDHLLVAVEGPYGPAAFPYQRYDSLILIAGGSGITPFLSLLQDVTSRNGNLNRYPTRIQLIYFVKRSEDLSMLTSISPFLLNQSPELGHLKLKVFVTQEAERSSVNVRELLYEMSQVKTVLLDPNSSINAAPRPEGLLWMATLTGVTSLIFLASLICLSHVFVHPERKSSQHKNPSWVNDLLVICSLVIAISCGIIGTVFSRWRKSIFEIHAVSQKHAKATKMHSMKVQDTQEEHEINFGQRPNLIDILSDVPKQVGGSKIGVFVCGPDSMQESVASFCKTFPHKLSGEREVQKCSLTFHSINFSL